MVAVVICEEHSYTVNTHVEHEQPKEYQQYESVPLSYNQESNGAQYQTEPENRDIYPPINVQQEDHNSIQQEEAKPEQQPQEEVRQAAPVFEYAPMQDLHQHAAPQQNVEPHYPSFHRANVHQAIRVPQPQAHYSSQESLNAQQYSKEQNTPIYLKKGDHSSEDEPIDYYVSKTFPIQIFYSFIK
jgi:hypothetical protein